MTKKWRARRGTPSDNHHACPPSDCMILDVEGTDGHGAFATVVVRMQGETEDRPEMVARAMLIAALPELLHEAEQLCEWAEEYMRYDKAPTHDQPGAVRALIHRIKAGKSST